MRALDNPLPSIRISATEALGSLGVAEAAEPLLERLGSPLPEERAAAFAALEALGAADGARSIQALLSGGGTVPPVLPDELARGLRAAAGLALADAELYRVARAARVLEALGATDALPEIRTAMRRFTGDRNPLRADLLAAIRGLEQYAALPRVPARVPSETDSLPLPARCSPTAQGLPVPARAPSDGKAPDRV
jgi:HEAT repeat protein